MARTASSGRSAHTLYGGHEHVLRQTLIALREGAALDEHENPGEATLQVLRRRVILVAGEGRRSGSAGHLMVVQTPGTPSRPSRTPWSCSPWVWRRLAIVDRVGRRRLTLVMVPGAAAALFVLGAFFVTGNAGRDQVPFIIACLVVFMFFNAGGLQLMGWLTGSEIYPLAVRGAGTSVQSATLWGPTC